jgi:hypothetical protein
MLRFLLRALLVLLLVIPFAGCAAIAGIFKAGVWVGVVIGVVVIVLLFAIFGRGK